MRIAELKFGFRPASLVLAMRMHPSHSAEAPSEHSPRARGTPGVERTHGLRHVATPKQTPIPAGSGISVWIDPQVRFLSSVPRAVFEAFLRMAPGG